MGFAFQADLAAAAMPDWTPPQFTLGSLDINGGLNQKILLGKLIGSPEFAFPFHLAHSLRTGERASEYAVPQLLTYIAPEGRDAILWVEPGGKRHRFSTEEVLKSLPSDLAELPEDAWTPISERIGDYLIASREGWIYEYQAGAIRKLTAPTGRILEFDTQGIRISGIRQSEANGTLSLSVPLGDFGLGASGTRKISVTFDTTEFSGSGSETHTQPGTSSSTTLRAKPKVIATVTGSISLGATGEFSGVGTGYLTYETLTVSE